MNKPYQPGLDGRHRDVNGEIEQKHSNALVRTLRQTYVTVSPRVVVPT